MKKFLLPFFINLFLLFIFVTPAQAVNISGEWVSKLGEKVEAKQSGDTFSLTVTDSRLPEYIGVVDLKGTITGNSFTGQNYYIADKCPSLTGYVSARGTISDEKIEAKGTGFEYDPDNCAKISNSEYDIIYTKTITASPIPTGIKETSPQPKQSSSKDNESKSQNAEPAKQTKPGEDGNPFNIFGFNPLETWRNIQGLLDIPEGLNSLVQTSEILSGPAEVKINIPNPSISTDSEGKLWNFLPGYISPDQENITVVRGQGQVKPSNSDQSVTVSDTSKNMPAFGTFVDSIFTGNTSEMVTFRYTWGTKSGAVINVTPKTEVKILKPAQDKEARDIIRKIKLNKGELEIRVKNDNPENKFGVQTEILDLIVIGTHFWMSHDPDKKQTMVVVYEGKVEVKTKDGKTTTITPDGNLSAGSGQGKPGVVLVSQKLSVVKLAVASLVLIAIIAGTAFILKKRGKKVLTPKKKTSR